MLKHSSIYAFGNISRQLVGFIMLPVYTHYLTPTDYGVIGLLIFVVSLIELVFGANLFQAVPKFYYEQNSSQEKRSVISTAILVSTAVSSLAVFLVVLFRDPISLAAFGTTEHGAVVGIFAFLVLTQGLETYTMGYVRIQQKPWLFVGSSMAKLVMQLSLNIWLVVILEMGIMGVAISTAASSILFTSAMTFYTLWNTGVQFSKHWAQRLLLFCWPLWFGGLAGLYMGSANRYFIRLFGSLEDVGLFELAAKFGSIIAVLVWTPFAQYWQTERFSIYNGPDPIPTYQLVFKVITTLIFLVALGVALFGAPVIRIMAAPEFWPAAEAVPYLAFATVFQSLIFFNNFSLLVKEKTAWMTWNVYLTAAVATVFYLSLIPAQGFVGAAQALMLAQAVQFLIVFSVAKRHYDMQLSLKPLSVYLGVAVTALYLSTLFRNESLIHDAGIRAVIYIGACGFVSAYLLSNPRIRHEARRHAIAQFSRIRRVDVKDHAGES